MLVAIDITQLEAIVKKQVRQGVSDALREMHAKQAGISWGDVPLFVSRKKAAELLQVSTFTVDRYISAGLISSTKSGKAVRICKESIMKYLGIQKR